jgi:hypothetical protein
MTIYCIDDKYSPATKNALALAGIQMPVLNTPYTIRSVYMHKDIYHIRLNEIVNKEVIQTGTTTKMEPGFAYYRFTDVPDNVLCWETVHEIFKQQT